MKKCTCYKWGEKIYTAATWVHCPWCGKELKEEDEWAEMERGATGFGTWEGRMGIIKKYCIPKIRLSDKKAEEFWKSRSMEVLVRDETHDSEQLMGKGGFMEMFRELRGG